MVKLIRTHTYFMTFKEYKKKYLKEERQKIELNVNRDVLTRTRVIFE